MNDAATVVTSNPATCKYDFYSTLAICLTVVLSSLIIGLVVYNCIVKFYDAKIKEQSALHTYEKELRDKEHQYNMELRKAEDEKRRRLAEQKKPDNVSTPQK
ncbi:MAG: hypothetical protein K2H87_02540 [Duncaniella sp.]|nr:hypothetical protein [Duncaniella sp.]